MFSIFKRKEKQTCKHRWILNDIYAQWIDLRVEVTVEDRFVLYCTECKREKTVDENELFLMKSYGLLKQIK
ncbi:hypothetical protein [Brevibacillus laterosporus]|uniref:hypothetical protein n=1 Tax=Brevibacillus laterosporus TaxID=1465 RepID=UPI002E1B835F|nr:hypothetical protein [Brevibacillus laterosporus]MED1667212.1 hypothetical protein [Brevibacillus laterosporus]MED1719720.1 hypothetical protein [Brevibacillus laterosporus]